MNLRHQTEMGAPRRSTVPPLVVLSAALAVLLLIGWAVGEVVKSAAPAADLDAVRDLAADRSAWLTTAAHALSLLGSGYVVFPLAAVCCALLLTRRRRVQALALALGTIGGAVISNVDKLLVDRPRPPVHHLERVTSPSFPSGHATQASAVYVALLLVILALRPNRARGLVPAIIIGILVLGIAASRVYLGVHYPSDVAAGLGLGSGWSALVSGVLRARRPADPGHA